MCVCVFLKRMWVVVGVGEGAIGGALPGLELRGIAKGAHGVLCKNIS